MKDTNFTKSERVEYTLTGQHIGNALWGLRHMTAQSMEVRTALRNLAIRIRASDADMSGQNIGNAFLGLQVIISLWC